MSSLCCVLFLANRIGSLKSVSCRGIFHKTSPRLEHVEQSDRLLRQVRKAAKTKNIVLIVLVFCILGASSKLSLSYVSNSEKLKIVNVGLILYNSDVPRAQQVIEWIDSVNSTFVKWNFICEYNVTSNSTLVKFLESRGEILAQTFYPQLQGLTERKDAMDFLKTTFNVAGVTINGIFMFQPDTYTLNYARSQGFTHCVGYCFDQFRMDHMTMKGGWQLPYYHNEYHALMPSLTNDGLIVYPHLTWDWAASLTVSHQCCTHILGVRHELFPQDSERSNRYILDLIDANLGSVEPFGYAAYMFEWGWAVDPLNLSNYARSVTQNVIDRFGSYAQTYNETTEWFKTTYPDGTPTYHFTFTSPYDGSVAEWYYSRTRRIARVSNYVKSYIAYANQTDKYLVEVASINWSDQDSVVDNSLSFAIDDFEGGAHRDVPHGGSQYFDGNLADFPESHDYQPFLWIGGLGIIAVAAAIVTACLVFKRTQISIPKPAWFEPFKIAFLKFQRWLVKNPGAVFIVGFQALFSTSAVLLIQGASTLANDIAVYAYYLLVAGVALQAISFLRRKSEEDGHD